MLMLGMTCAVVGSSLYLTFATKFGMPVSTTHSLLGGVLGMGIASVGSGGVIWWGGDVNSGVVSVFLAWIIAPFCSGGFAAIIFLITKYGVMLRKNPVAKAMISTPIYFGITSGLITMLIVWKGGSARINISDAETIGIIFGVGGAVALLVAIFFLPWLYRVMFKNDWELKSYHVLMGPLLLRRADPPPPPEGYQAVQNYYAGHMTMEELQAKRAAAADVENAAVTKEKGLEASDDVVNSDSDSGKPHRASVPLEAEEPKPWSIIGERPAGKSNFHPAVLFWYFKRVFFRGVEKDVLSMQKKRDFLTGDHLDDIHARAQHYDNRAEYMYSFLQVLTASAASFTHGANDVSK